MIKETKDTGGGKTAKKNADKPRVEVESSIAEPESAVVEPEAKAAESETAKAEAPAAAAELKEFTPEERWNMIAKVAYYRAEKRGFVGGNPAEDWRAAEADVDAQLAEKRGRAAPPG